MENIKKRIEFIDIIKGLAIILVVIGHTSPDSNEIITYKSVVYAFHMPLFYILSGLFVVTSKENYSLQTFKNFVHKNFVALLIPYFIWGLIYANFSYTNVMRLCYGSWIELFNMKSLTSLWFIIVLFVGRIYLEIFFMMINKFKINFSHSFIIAIPIFFLLGLYLPHHNDVQTQMGNFFSYDIAFIASAFMLLGVVLKSFIKNLINFKNSLLIFLMIISASLFYLGFSLTNYTKEFVLMANSTYLNPFLFISNSLTGSFAIIFLGVLIYKIPAKKRILNFLGVNSMAIFLTHRHIVVTLLNYLQTNTNLSRLTINFIISVIALVISSLLTILINKFAPIMFGKNK